MPIVPKIERQVEGKTAPMPQLAMGETPEISGIGQPEKTAFGMPKIDAIVDKLITDEIKRVDDAVGMDNDLRLSIDADTIEEAAKQYRGADSVQAMDRAMEMWADASSKVREKVKTRGQEEWFNKSVLKNSLRIQANVGNHISRETEKYYHDSYEASMVKLKDDAGKNPDIFVDNKREMEERTRRFGQSMGWSSEQIENRIKLNNSELVLNAIKQLKNNNDPQGALDMFNKNKSEIPEKDRLGMGEDLKKEADMREGEILGREVFKEDKTINQMYAEIGDRAGSNALKKKAAEEEVDKQINKMKISKNLAEESAFNLVYLEIIKQREAGGIPRWRDIPVAIREAAKATNSQRWDGLTKSLEAEKNAPKTQREIDRAHDRRFSEIMADKELFKMDTKTFDNWALKESGENKISDKQAVKLMEIHDKIDPLNSTMAKNARSRLKAVFARKIASTKDDDEKAAINAELEDAGNMLDNLIMNNYNLSPEEYSKKVDKFIDEVIKPAEIGYIDNVWNAIGWGLKEPRSEKKIKELVGQEAPGLTQKLGVGKGPIKPEKKIFENLPDAKLYPNKTFKDDTTKKRYRSNGKEWIEVK